MVDCVGRNEYALDGGCPSLVHEAGGQILIRVDAGVYLPCC